MRCLNAIWETVSSLLRRHTRNSSRERGSHGSGFVTSGFSEAHHDCWRDFAVVVRTDIWVTAVVGPRCAELNRPFRVPSFGVLTMRCDAVFK